MSEELNQEIEQPTEDITDEQLDKFFEEGGKEPPAVAEVTQDKEPEQEKQATESLEQIEEKHARNYQAAMKEERARRQELARELEETRAHQAKMEATFQKFLEKQQEAARPPIPSYDEDPLENMRIQQKELQEYVVQQNQYLQQQQQTIKVQQQEAQFINSYVEKAKEFAAENPDFTDAYNYLASKKMAEYQAAGLTPQEADYQIKMEEAKIVSHAFRQGVNPAERVYAMAKASGFLKQTPTNQNQGNNAEIEKKLEEIQKNIKLNRTLSGNPGKADTVRTPSLSNLANLSEDELDDLILDDKQWKKLMRAG